MFRPCRVFSFFPIEFFAFNDFYIKKIAARPNGAAKTPPKILPHIIGLFTISITSIKITKPVATVTMT